MIITLYNFHFFLAFINVSCFTYHAHRMFFHLFSHVVFISFSAFRMGIRVFSSHYLSQKPQLFQYHVIYNSLYFYIPENIVILIIHLWYSPRHSQKYQITFLDPRGNCLTCSTIMEDWYYIEIRHALFLNENVQFLDTLFRF